MCQFDKQRQREGFRQFSTNDETILILDEYSSPSLRASEESSDNIARGKLDVPRASSDCGCRLHKGTEDDTAGCQQKRAGGAGTSWSRGMREKRHP